LSESFRFFRERSCCRHVEVEVEEETKMKMDEDEDEGGMS
jgi:hypothetical protein